ncbi:hypothetical protein TNCV_2378821 [Trichonephila clavipes]|uniref:Uncharacterized protein n=1 Tax=Trichonephila clavipes TaxID=2585209 RepID=A0A8X6RLU7_TRICX|nr:hypothetical protein TNCV_2378821 [Trichonephila clavipes]
MNVLNVMRLYKRKSAVLEGFKWRCRMGMLGHYLAEYVWRCSHGHSLSAEVFKAFLKSAVKLYPSLGKDQQFQHRTSLADPIVAIATIPSELPGRRNVRYPNCGERVFLEGHSVLWSRQRTRGWRVRSSSRKSLKTHHAEGVEDQMSSLWCDLMWKLEEDDANSSFVLVT